MKKQSRDDKASKRSLVKSRRHRMALLGLSVALAVFGGTMAALTVYFLSLNTEEILVKPLALLPIGIAGLTGVFIAVAVHAAGLVGWLGYLLKVLFSAACALGSGLWMELLVNVFGCEWHLPGQLVDSISKSSFDPIEFSLFMSRACCLCFAVLVAILTGVVRAKRSPVGDLGET